MSWIVTLGLFLLTAVAEIVGCYWVLLWAKRGASLWVLAGAVVSLMVFAWLLTRHPAESGRVYAAYGGVYTCTALAWLWIVDRVTPTVFSTWPASAPSRWAAAFWWRLRFADVPRSTRPGVRTVPAGSLSHS